MNKLINIRFNKKTLGFIGGLFISSILLALTSCSTLPPKNLDNSCDIFFEKDDWYDEANDSYKKWGVPVHVQLAIIHQESRFKDDAQTDMEYFLWLIPIGRKSDAYGYAQVKDETWDWYIQQTGNTGADRDDFDDAVDFIGWYGNYTYKKLKAYLNWMHTVSIWPITKATPDFGGVITARSPGWSVWPDRCRAARFCTIRSWPSAAASSGRASAVPRSRRG